MMQLIQGGKHHQDSGNEAAQHNTFDLQRYYQHFQALLIGGNVHIQSDDSGIEQWIKPSNRMSAAQHFAIYRRSYFTRLIHCLGEQFPALKFLLGDEVFKEFAVGYLLENPSESYTLSDLGAGFPAYLLRTRGKQIEDWSEFMLELADYEWQRHVLFDAKVEPYATAELITADSKLKINPSVILLDYHHDVVTFQRCCELEENPSPKLNVPVKLSIFRRDYQIITMLLTPFQLAFLQQLMASDSVLQALRQVGGNFSMDIQEILKSWQQEPTREQWIDKHLLVAE